MVLIPILMDYPLGARAALERLGWDFEVLIPILMDYPLGGWQTLPHRCNGRRLNPYSNGLPSRGLTKANLSEAYMRS